MRTTAELLQIRIELPHVSNPAISLLRDKPEHSSVRWSETIHHVAVEPEAVEDEVELAAYSLRLARLMRNVNPE